MTSAVSSNSDKSALVTGASSGIGEAFARKLADEGFRVTCVARNEEKLNALIQQMGEGHRCLPADLTDTRQLASIEADIRQNHYHLLINNAGYAVYDTFENVPVKNHEGVIRLNISALVKLSYAYLADATAGDTLVNVSSALSRLSYPGGAVYCGTKAFVTCFTESLWYEYKPRDVYVTALLPGLTDTNFHNVALEGRSVEKPKGLNRSPEDVVREALAVLKQRRKPSHICGRRYRVLTAVVNKLMSRKKMIALMGKRSMGIRMPNSKP